MSVTLDTDHLRSTTTSRADPSFKTDRLWLNGEEEEIKERARLQAEAAVKRKEEERQAAELTRKAEESKAAAADQRNQLGQTTAFEDWTVGRTFLHVSSTHAILSTRLTIRQRIKGETMPSVKLETKLRLVYNAQRRKITAKIGQITNDEAVIQGIVGR